MSIPQLEQHGRLRAFLASPLSTYYLLMASTVLLLILGLIMVLSASSIESFRVHGSPYVLAQRQALFAIIGLALMFGMARMPVEFWRGIAWPALLLAFVLLILVLFIGVEVAGQRNWIQLVGPFRIQPSEFAKIGLILWGADVLARKERHLDTWSHLLIPVLPVAAAIMGLIFLEGDVGNAMMIGAIAAGIFFAAGAPLRLFVGLGVAGGLLLWVMAIAAPYRMARFTSWLDPGADRLGSGWQLTQGKYAFGTGGLVGVGIGGSREKWGSLPEAHTDFIFPVIGEELGLLGTLLVLALFSVLAFAIFRLARTTGDLFVRLAASGVGCWIVVQAMVNIGAVLGLLPITGVPLPLVSYGGSSLVPTLCAVGLLMACARAEPRARTVLRRRATSSKLAAT
jgi:cell division protein FtsW